MRKNLQYLELNSLKTGTDEGTLAKKTFITKEGFAIKSDYSENDLLNNELLDFGAGFPPYLRGTSTTMYIRNTWNIHQNQPFSTALEANSFYKKKLATGQKNISVVFDLPTQKGYDSDNNLALDELGKEGIAIDTVEDMKILFDQIPLDKISLSMCMNDSFLVLLAFYVVTAEEQGIKPEQLSGVIQDTVFDTSMLGNKQNSPEYLISIFEYIQKKTPQFNTVCISGLSIHEAGVTPDLELAYTLSKGLEYCIAGLKSGMKIDDVAPRLSFSFGVGMNHFAEIAKLRAARMIWARLIKPYNPQNTNSLALQIHSTTSDESVTIQDPFNNISRTCIQAAAAVFGGTQSLQTNSLDESKRVEFSSRIAKNTQLYLQEETKITKTVDPWGGSYYVECLTQEIFQNTWKRIEEIENLGGFTKALEADFFKLQIEESATKTQTINNHSIGEDQLKRLNQLKKTRNFEKVKLSLGKLRENTPNDLGELFERIIDASRNRATLGEICEALEMNLK